VMRHDGFGSVGDTVGLIDAVGSNIVGDDDMVGDVSGGNLLAAKTDTLEVGGVGDGGGMVALAKEVGTVGNVDGVMLVMGRAVGIDGGGTLVGCAKRWGAAGCSALVEDLELEWLRISCCNRYCLHE